MTGDRSDMGEPRLCDASSDRVPESAEISGMASAPARTFVKVRQDSSTFSAATFFRRSSSICSLTSLRCATKRSASRSCFFVAAASSSVLSTRIERRCRPTMRFSASVMVPRISVLWPRSPLMSSSVSALRRSSAVVTLFVAREHSSSLLAMAAPTVCTSSAACPRSGPELSMRWLLEGLRSGSSSRAIVGDERGREAVSEGSEADFCSRVATFPREAPVVKRCRVRSMRSRNCSQSLERA
mmetsp:Transcript_18945/g.59510  ORF Transcript_18945/g.59510 Transcript_18945/m.59510 type:complete len:241 (-) Transcript_18945:662-1384(-)